jgi:tetratricopeptide (TPR) repeat protein
MRSNCGRRQRLSIGPPHALYELAKAREAVGQAKDAHATYAEFERLGSAPETATDDARLDLILMYAGSPATAPNALKLAQQEIAARQDVWTLDAFAWALYANAKYEEADAAVQKAIAVGIESARIFGHAGHIAQKLHHGADAIKYFQLSIQSNPSSEYTADARQRAGAQATNGCPANQPPFSSELCGCSATETCGIGSAIPIKGRRGIICSLESLANSRCCSCCWASVTDVISSANCALQAVH